MRQTGLVARKEQRILMGKPEGKRPLERPRLRWMMLKWIFQR
jgi:hypothetical protein